MSELSNRPNSGQDFRWHLLSTVSALVLLAAVHQPNEAEAVTQDLDRPTVWVELGGQLEQIDTDQQAFVPPFFTPHPLFTTITPDYVQKPLGYSYGAEGKVSFQPDGTDWVFSAAIRYGRSNGSKHVHMSTKPAPIPIIISGEPNGFYVTRANPKFADAASKRSQNYAIVDFLVGKDVGVGMFGNDSRSVINFGLRIAQFHSTLQASLGLDPDTGGYKYLGTSIRLPTNNPHVFLASVESNRSFYGIGPSVSWDGSAPFLGNSDRGELTFDWGVNAAVLFGRQKTSVHHQTTAQSRPSPLTNPYNLVHTLYQSAMNHARSRSVTVPNVGGFAGTSLKFSNAKISLGYRADFFLGPIDAGIDTRKSEDIGFHGPFATISFGLP